jgi:hypothetical protein
MTGICSMAILPHRGSGTGSDNRRGLMMDGFP